MTVKRAHRPRPLLVSALVIAVVTGACGGDTDDGVTSDDTTAEPTVAADEPEPDPTVAATEPEPDPTVAATEPGPEPGTLTVTVEGIEGESKLVIALAGPDDAIPADVKASLADGVVPVDPEGSLDAMLVFEGAYCRPTEDMATDNELTVRAMATNGNPCVLPGTEDDDEFDISAEGTLPGYEFAPGTVWLFVGIFVGGEVTTDSCAMTQVEIDGDTTVSLTLEPCGGA